MPWNQWIRHRNVWRDSRYKCWRKVQGNRFHTSRRTQSSKIRSPHINISNPKWFISHWSIQTWISFLRRGGGPKKRLQYFLNPASPEHFLYFRVIQEHSGDVLADSTLQDNVLFSNDFVEYIHQRWERSRLASHHSVGNDSWKQKSEEK